MLRNLIITWCLTGFTGTVFADTVSTLMGDLILNANRVQSTEHNQDTPRVLITHGTLGHNRMETIAALQEALAEVGFDSLAINLSLGINDRHDRYDCATPHRHQHADAANEIAHWTEWLGQQSEQPIILLGHSRGGNQTAWYTSSHSLPATLQAQVLLAPMTWNAEREQQQYMERHGTELHSLLTMAEGAQAKGQDLMQPVDLLYCSATAASPASILSYYADDPRRHTPTLLEKSRLPTLVITGSADTTVPDLDDAMSEVSNPNVTIVSIDGADHFFRDLYTYDVVDLLTTFMETLN